MDYTAKILKALYEIVEMLKSIKKQNNTIIHRLESIEEINADAHGYVLKDIESESDNYE